MGKLRSVYDLDTDLPECGYRFKMCGQYSHVNCIWRDEIDGAR